MSDKLEKSTSPIILFKKLRENAIIPQRATDGAAGFDLAWSPRPEDEVRLVQGKFTAIDASRENRQEAGYEPSYVFETGIAAAIPVGYVGLVFSRSGHGFHANVRMANCVGVIDSDYRGEIRVKLTIDAGFHQFQVGERIAQLVVTPCIVEAREELGELEDTIRATAGFGSTGR